MIIKLVCNWQIEFMRSSTYKDDCKAHLSRDNSHERAMKGRPHERTNLDTLKLEINSTRPASNK